MRTLIAAPAAGVPGDGPDAVSIEEIGCVAEGLEIFKSQGIKPVKIIDLNGFLSVNDFPEVHLTGSMKLLNRPHVATLDTDQVYILIGKGWSRAGTLVNRYQVVAPTVEQTDGTFDPEKHISFRPVISFVRGRRNADGTSQGRQLMARRANIDRTNESNNALFGETGEPNDPHVVRESRTSRGQAQEARWWWDATRETNLDRLFGPIVAAMRAENVVPDEVLLAMDGTEGATGLGGTATPAKAAGAAPETHVPAGSSVSGAPVTVGGDPFGDDE